MKNSFDPTYSPTADISSSAPNSEIPYIQQAKEYAQLIWNSSLTEHEKHKENMNIILILVSAWKIEEEEAMLELCAIYNHPETWKMPDRYTIIFEIYRRAIVR